MRDVTDSDLSSPTIHAVGKVSIQTNGTDRGPSGEEEFTLGNYRLYHPTKVTSLIVQYRSVGGPFGAQVYTWWKNGITYGYPGPQPGILVQPRLLNQIKLLLAFTELLQLDLDMDAL